MKNRKLKSLSLAVLTLIMAVFCFGIYGAGAEAVTEQHLFDECDVIDDSREAELNDILGKTAKENNLNIAVVFVNDVGGKSEEAFADDYYDDLYGINTDGVLMLVSYNPRYFHISTSGIGIDYYDKRIDEIIGNIKPYLSGGDEYNAVVEFNSNIAKFAYMPSFNWGKTAAIAFAISLVVALIWAGIIVHGYKVPASENATEYAKNGNINFRVKTDRYITKHVTRTKISTDSGSGTHTSSSGGTHGGGGSSF